RGIRERPRGRAGPPRRTGRHAPAAAGTRAPGRIGRNGSPPMKKKIDQAPDEISEEAFDEKVVRRLLPYLRPRAAEISFSLLLVFLSAAVALYAPRLLGRIVDQAILPHNFKLLYQLAGLYAGLELLRLACVYGQSYRLQVTGQAV